jgi:sterol O-acyltransferase
MAVNGYLQTVDERAIIVQRKLRARTEDVGGWDEAVSDARAKREELEQEDTTPSETPALIISGDGIRATGKEGNYFSQGPAATALRNRLQNLDVPIPSTLNTSTMPTSLNPDRAKPLKRNLSAASMNSDSSHMSTPAPKEDAILPAPHVLVDHPDKSISNLARDLSEMEVELTSTGKNQVRWPANLTWWNYIDYQLLPTLVYELEYPRTER